MTHVLAPAPRPGNALPADILARSFEADPLLRWMFTGSVDLGVAMERWWGAHLASSGRGVELLAGPTGQTAALWQAPVLGREPADFKAVDGLVAVKVLLAEVGRARALDAVGSHRSELAPHWYLIAVGALPDSQCRGLGQAVVRPVLERCDADGLPAYLESSNPRNVSFYERLGFVATGELQVSGGPVLIPMWREPS